MIALSEYLNQYGYKSLEDWGRDSDYFPTQVGWVDEHGNLVDLYQQWVAAMESSGE